MKNHKSIFRFWVFFFLFKGKRKWLTSWRVWAEEVLYFGMWAPSGWKPFSSAIKFTVYVWPSGAVHVKLPFTSKTSLSVPAFLITPSSLREVPSLVAKLKNIDNEILLIHHNLNSLSTIVFSCSFFFVFNVYTELEFVRINVHITVLGNDFHIFLRRSQSASDKGQETKD